MLQADAADRIQNLEDLKDNDFLSGNSDCDEDVLSFDNAGKKLLEI